MKWNNRLKSVLAGPEKSGFPEDCLETELRITAKSNKFGVSAVIRSDEFRQSSGNQTNSSDTEKQENLVSAVIRSSISRDCSQNNDELETFKAESLHKILNRFIEAGITFEVTVDDFQTIDTGGILKSSDRDFLKLNRATILCQLQQSLLMKHLLSHSPEQFENFASEIIKHKKMPYADVEVVISYKVYFTAISEITKKWFEILLKSGE